MQQAFPVVRLCNNGTTIAIGSSSALYIYDVRTSNTASPVATYRSVELLVESSLLFIRVHFICLFSYKQRSFLFGICARRVVEEITGYSFSLQPRVKYCLFSKNK